MRYFNLFEVFKNEGLLATLQAYSAIEHSADPYEDNKTIQYLNPLPIKAIVIQVGFSALKWKFFGQLPTGTIQIICEPKNYSLLINADKIVYKENNYYVYKDDSKRFMILSRPDYLVAVLEQKND